jgi:hypothetical protein
MRELGRGAPEQQAPQRAVAARADDEQVDVGAELREFFVREARHRVAVGVAAKLGDRVGHQGLRVLANRPVVVAALRGAARPRAGRNRRRHDAEQLEPGPGDAGDARASSSAARDSGEPSKPSATAPRAGCESASPRGATATAHGAPCSVPAVTSPASSRPPPPGP